MIHSCLQLKLITSNVNFKAYLTNPTVSRSAKVDMVDKAFDAKSKTSAVTKNLLLTMAGNNRLGVADKVTPSVDVATVFKCCVWSWVLNGFLDCQGPEDGNKICFLFARFLLPQFTVFCTRTMFVFDFTVYRFCVFGFPQVIDAFTRMLKAKKGEVDAIVTTAEPLSPQQEKSLAAGLKAQVNLKYNPFKLFRRCCSRL